jgi:hypothetical protein
VACQQSLGASEEPDGQRALRCATSARAARCAHAARAGMGEWSMMLAEMFLLQTYDHRMPAVCRAYHLIAMRGWSRLQAMPELVSWSARDEESGIWGVGTVAESETSLVLISQAVEWPLRGFRGLWEREELQGACEARWVGD